MFIIRAAFWLTLVVAFVPVRDADLGEGQRAVSTMETVNLAQSVVTDVSSFCARNQQTCETGGVLFSQMGLKAREGAKLAYQWLDKQVGEKGEKASVDQTTTSSLIQ
jgi:hypothetical protein